MDSRWVFGTVAPNPAGLVLAINVAKSALFLTGEVLVSETKVVRAFLASVAVKGEGDGDGSTPKFKLRGVSSRLIVFASILASAGTWREFRLIPPARMG